MIDFAFVFDFDGPIFDGRMAAQKAVESTISYFKPSLGDPEFDFSGIPLLNPRRLVNLIYANSYIDSKHLDDIVKYFSDILSQIEQEIQIDKSIVQVLKTLSESKIRSAIFTSRKSASVMQLLNSLHIQTWFDKVIGKDSTSKPKPNPEGLRKIASEFNIPADHIIFIGDTDYDLLAARECGAVYYHAGWTSEPSFLSAREARRTISDPLDILEIIESLKYVVGVDEDRVPQDLRNAINADCLAFYAGAGVSVDSGIGDWELHYRSVLQSLKGTFIAEDYGATNAIQLMSSDPLVAKKTYDIFRESFENRGLEPNHYHFSIIRSGVRHIWTSNYDDLFEKANISCDTGVSVIADDSTLLDRFRNLRLLIKMNGDCSSARFGNNLKWNWVLSKEQFDVAEQDRSEIWRLFEDDYRNSCIVFVGLSFNDPALSRMLTRIAQRIPRTRCNHYFLTTISNDPIKQRSNALFAQNLERHSIKTLFFRTHDQIGKFITEVCLASFRPIVGFSGSYWDPKTSGSRELTKIILKGGELSDIEVEQICSNAGRRLAQRGLRVTSGGARYVGIPAVSSAFDVDSGLARIYSRMKTPSSIPRAAPIIVVKGNDLDAMRQRFIGEIDLLIAVAGVTYDERGSSGVINEIEMALKRNIPVILIPQAGGSVYEYYEKIINCFTKYYTDSRVFEIISQINSKIKKLDRISVLKYSEDDLANDVITILTALARSPMRSMNRKTVW